MTLEKANASLKEKDELLTQLSSKDWFYIDLILRELRSICVRVSNEDEMTVISANVVCTPEYFFTQCELFKSHIDHFIILSELLDGSPDFSELVKLLLSFFHQLFFVYNCGKLIYQTLPNIEHGQDLMNRCKDLISLSISMIDELLLRQDSSTVLRSIETKLNEVLQMKTVILPELSLNDSKNLEDLLFSELSDMDKAIHEAALKIEEMMNKAKKQDKGVKLEVNAKVLDSCTGLMKAILELVKNAKELQKEIVSQGKVGKLVFQRFKFPKKGMANSNEFYQRNHRWTEGLISAAKVVALAATLLVDAADKVVAGSAKFEELMVASQEIAAATAQLVVASRVKADKSSEKMGQLLQSSKKVSEATGNVVATAKNCAQLVEETDTLDFSKLTLHQAKRLEMESQVRVIELETQINKERMRLAGLRKRHYHLGFASEGLDRFIPEN
ncbi:huntingtin-interacting protein 1-like protein [Leptotrombidium deliense]|uniref:Huntingtin-interacting protein 1-like protein n=1 Tax=Leptotrombidium deliense TaxID=299467 RepID=A0A443S626_9ACAR|nr:huntingtin-interacting protein 1-like protein [Leptotrombidium deliense]